jgi:hypothetical protein
MSLISSDSPTTVDHLPPIGLEELIAIADLQTRRDRKYLLPASVAADVFHDIQGRALDIDGLRAFRYESTYFDTPQWDSYLSAARRRPRRFKVRTRTYLDSNACMLEVKVRDNRGNTVKHRQPHDPCIRAQLTEDGEAFVKRIPASAPFVRDLRAVLTVMFRRSTIVLDETGERITVDEHARWSSDASHRRLDVLVFVETKTTGPPSDVDRALWRAGHRPVTISKYCTGLAAMRSDLPSNKWHRVLIRDLIPNLQSSA